MNFKCLILLIAAIVKINVTESRRGEERRRWKNNRGFSHPVNICDIQDRGSKVHCYCDTIKIKMATRADCWVFNGGIAVDDPFWSTFYTQPNVEKLVFNVRADGGLTYIPTKVIAKLEHLKYLNIQYANIFNIPAFAFENSTKLREIVMPKDKIMKLEKMAFAHLLMLTNISLVENQISEIEQDVFYMLPNLQSLYLSKNTLNVLHDGCFEHLSNLIKLDLHNNLLTVVIRENFQGLSNLITLDMRKNKLTMIGDLAFAELWNLQELYLDGNEIEFISERGFSGLSQLNKLSLPDNKLKTLENGVFGDVQKLTVLDLKNNDLVTLRKEVVEKILENMKTHYGLISLNGNNLTCDCRLSWLHTLYNETQSKRLKTSLKYLNCNIDNKFKISTDTTIDNTENSAKLNLNVYRKDYEEVDFEYDKIYDDVKSRDAEANRKVLQVLDKLLCPYRLHSEGTYSPPTQDEVRYYQASSSEKTCLNSILLLIIVKYF
ncbi:connectin-like [Achroia grisella]|uniref:connectin-like n=1 Tax=Achroia grisella TaxID=688607 RepID=UPI0027D20695|nr:connectin-like [Achroia grisella]XP_059062933.1 connectin-like [Achroia grisella]XP_059062934.1 connectin-like [Achroia grisella]